MATIVRKEAVERPLHVVSAGGWFGGFGNLLRKELGQWWGTRTGWIQTLIWIAILNGISTIVMLTESGDPDAQLIEVVQTFLPMSVGALAIGTVIAVQGALVGEKELGTAAWVMSKPASRYAFILAKVVSYAASFWLSAILIPSTLFVVTASLLLQTPLSLGSFLPGVAIVALSQLFYLMLTLMLGTFFNSRGPIAAIGIAVVLTGLLLKSIIPMPILLATPWPLPDVSAGLALGASLPETWPIPVIATALWTVLFTILALWRFNREEF